MNDEQILQVISQYLGENMNFTVESIVIDDSVFGNYLVLLSSPRFLVRFIKDKSDFWCQVGSNDQWNYLDDVCVYLDIKETVNCMTWETMLTSSITILNNYYNKISVLYDDKNYGYVKKKLKTIHLMRLGINNKKSQL